MRRRGAARRRGRALLIAGALLAAAGAALFAAFSGLAADESARGREQGSGALVVLECEGWTGANVPLGVFAEGAAADGGRRAEHLLFEGSGSREVGFCTGECTAVPQLPQVMLQDGRVLSAGDPARARCEDDGVARLRLAYEAVDLRGTTDDELADIAAASFLDEDAAACALESAKALRDRAAQKEEDDV